MLTIHYTSVIYFDFFFLIKLLPPKSTLFPYTTLFRSRTRKRTLCRKYLVSLGVRRKNPTRQSPSRRREIRHRSEEHTSELQSHVNIVCRLLLEKKKKMF